HPEGDHVNQLILGYSPHPPSRRGDRLDAVAAAGLPFDQRVDLFFAPAGVHHAVNYAHAEHIIGTIDFARQKKLFRCFLANSAVEEGVGSHAGEEIEEDFGESKASMPLGDHDVARQGGLEATAEALPLDERDGRDREPMTDVVAVKDVDAGFAVA